MSNTDFRLSGGIAPDLTVEEIRAERLQTMHQGIGFDLRVVSNVPLTDSGDLINEETVASGAFMQFMIDGWVEGKYHPRGSVVTDGVWTMVANSLTLDSPYPVPGGDSELGLGAWVPLTQDDSSVVYSGHRYVVGAKAVWARRLNVYVTQLTADTNYRIVVIEETPDSPPVTTVIADPILQENAWVTIALLDRIIRAGTTLLIYIDALNSGANQTVTGGWNYTGQDNVAPPADQSWNVNNARTILRIDKNDLDGTDRTSELLGFTVNTTVQFADTSNPSAFDLYRVTSAPPRDLGTYVEYDVVLQQTGEGGVPLGTTTMTATIPIPLPTQYAQEVGTVPTYTGPDVVAEGFLRFDGVDQAGAESNAYGIDVEFESVEASPDWSVLSYITT